MRTIDADALKKLKVYSEERREYVVSVFNIDNAPTVPLTENNDLISREDLKEFINSTIASATKVGIVADADYLWELLNYAIDNAPTVEDRPKGKWIFNKYNVWECSCCGGNPHSGTGYVPSIPMMKKQWKFCNLCGAQMGVDDNECNNIGT